LLVKYKKGTDKRNGNKKEKEIEEENKKWKGENILGHTRTIVAGPTSFFLVVVCSSRITV
jgi:hypothetical protein